MEKGLNETTTLKKNAFQVIQTTNEIPGLKSKFFVKDVESLLKDSPLSRDEADELFQVIMDDRKVRRNLADKSPVK